MPSSDVRSVHPLTAQKVIQKQIESIDMLMLACLGYKPSDQYALMEKIVKLAITHRQNTASKEVSYEYSRLLDKYEQEFAWIHNV